MTLKHCAIWLMALLTLGGCSKDINVICEGRERDTLTNQVGPETKLALSIKFKGKSDGSTTEKCDVIVGTDSMQSCHLIGDTVFAVSGTQTALSTSATNVMYTTTTKSLEVTKAVVGPNTTMQEFKGICK